MLNVVLYQPEIPPNTGNVIRLCANTGATLSLIEPLGFDLEDRQLRRAGLDYHEYANVRTYGDLDKYLEERGPERVLAFTTRAQRHHSDFAFTAGDALLFGPETRGLPATVLARIPADHQLRLPMVASSRSLNLSNAVAVAVFEAWRQLGYRGGQ